MNPVLQHIHMPTSPHTHTHRERHTHTHARTHTHTHTTLSHLQPTHSTVISPPSTLRTQTSPPHFSLPIRLVFKSTIDMNISTEETTRERKWSLIEFSTVLLSQQQDTYFWAAFVSSVSTATPEIIHTDSIFSIKDLLLLGRANTY